MNSYNLEPARLGDARQLAAMSELHIETGLRPAWSAARIAWHIRHPESVVLPARSNRATVGFALMRYGEDAAHLNLLAVEPAQRRRGVARTLLCWLEATAMTAGTFEIGLELRATNQIALAFYAACGYREAGRVCGYYQGVESAIRMTRDLRVSLDATPGLDPR